MLQIAQVALKSEPRMSHMTSVSTEAERYEHVGTITPTSKMYHGMYQFTNEPTLVHLVEWDDEITLCGLPRDAFVELDPVFQVDEFPSCDECRELANLRIIEGIINRQSAVKTEALKAEALRAEAVRAEALTIEAVGTDTATLASEASIEIEHDGSVASPVQFDDLITRMNDILDALRDAIVEGDRETYIAARRRWQTLEAELDELLPAPKLEPVI